MQNDPHTTLVTPTAPIANTTHGGRAKCLQRLVRLDLPVPRTIALSFDAVQQIARGQMPDVQAVVDQFPKGALLCVRPSSQDPDWGGPGAVLNIGINDALFESYAGTIGEGPAAALYSRFVQSYAVNVARLDPDMFDDVNGDGRAALMESLRAYEAETEERFPQDPATQLAAVLRSMARAWNGTSARLLRQAKGAPADAGLGLVVQEMAFGVGQGQCGSGVLQLVDSDTGLPQITGRYLSQSQGRDALEGDAAAMYLTRDPRGQSLEELVPEAFAELKDHAALMRKRLRAEMQVEFVIDQGKLHILDGVKVARSSRAAVRIAVALADEGIISREEALMRVQPRTLSELLHRQVDPSAKRDVIGRGIAASPGAATGRIVFSASDAQASAARGEPCILVRRETSPEDIRGMHAAAAVLTERGGITSHAAVIGRGMGLPCVVGASNMRFVVTQRQIIAPDGRVFVEGDQVTVDGSTGQVLAGAAKMQEAALDDTFNRLMGWAEDVADIGIRANADTPTDAQTARNFNAHGIGLCRTEHMFFEPGRLTVMREMIFAESGEDRRAVLERLLPMQREDFTQLFRIMQGQPVCIRLFDPPLHEFLPSDKAGQRELAEALGLQMSDVTRRVAAMTEYNPMLGLRGVRLGVTVPEIYEMQARAIFEATIEASRDGEPVVPEIMIPLVSARREVELVKASVDAVAAAVRSERDASFTYRLGVMVETPRACLRADDIAPHCAFLSFGTNDLTQMTYGLSRDDAGRFMSNYVQQGVYPEDPFHVLDTDGVGELLQLGAERGRKAQPGITLSICGEHGGNPESIAFCRESGFDYVSCSPFRVPVARLAAAQLAIAHKIG
ncbi:pyruvate, phosphate dikinase [Sulfitobacter sp. KE29]|uniref:pyruvate, phosphate dikinase n=1 Tax=unclassified Sulfitobacter TaxID=196795 RepID=UPI0007C3BAAE|nr:MULTISPECIES: pyruvate, phosphate dikinase [unclassified Sulfitobacter]MBO9438814.1 pyruvate, phosphate dikinase [Sulfitobacter sp. R18_2]KZY52985.1 pyruvate, phosphate dikinase [Sulfitobacter sp. HI0054]MDF3418022.1 pyruvate, phosphate dikinase [Sulfitobacter sp. Ks38]MDF3425504.1 pyruvate, phosphate dikinase [Sulfitobacter sp. KE29]MDF3429085.1 pyruvate, phosphate dikinase [Sulfitobacter sp. S46]